MHAIYFVVQRTFEFTEKNNKKVKEDVSLDVKDNYVQYHMKDDDTEIWVIEDFNRVSIDRRHIVLQHGPTYQADSSEST